MKPRNSHASRTWRVAFRVIFRWFRITVLVFILALLGALLYLNQVGLPAFLKEPLLQKLKARGVDLEFKRLRWRWDHGLVAEKVHFGGAATAATPALTVDEIEVELNYHALFSKQIQVDSLVLHNGRLSLPVTRTNASPNELIFDRIQAELHLLPNDMWELDHFRAQFAAGVIQFTGVITNASAFSQWKMFHARERAPAGLLLRRVQLWADSLAQIDFAAPPHLRVDVHGDAKDPHSFAIQGHLSAPRAESSWGTFEQIAAAIQLSPADTNEWSRAEFRLEAGNARTPWAAATNLTLTLHLLASGPETNDVQADLDLSAENVSTRWGEAGRAHLTGQWLHSLTNPVPRSGWGGVELANVKTRWAVATNARFSGSFTSATNHVVPDPSWSWWSNLAPYALTWECRLQNVEARDLAAEELAGAGQWLAPDLELTRIAASLYGGSLSARAHLNAPTRKLYFSGSSDFDAHKISGLLTAKSQHWLSQFSWQTPPALQAEGALTLPEWTNRHPDWVLDVKPTVQLHGHFHVENGSFRGVPASSAQGHFEYSNELWRLPDLVVLRPEGRVDIVHESNERTRDYYFSIHSSIDPGAARPLLDAKQQRGLNLVVFAEPPRIDGEIWGRWYDYDRIGAKLRVAANHFTLRGESADSFEAQLEYTNRFLYVIEPRVQREHGTQHMAASSVGVDFSAEKAFLTNGYGTADPNAVARAIGPNIGRAVEPYRFLLPPTARVHGVIPFRDERLADLHFEVDGGPLEWWKLKTPRIIGKVDWVGRQLVLRDVQAEFYNGAGSGSAEFNFEEDHATTFKFKASVTDADLHQLMGDLSSKTNRLEGLLSARAEVTNAHSKDWRSWQGSGRADLRDGLIWDIPIFGIFTPALDAIMPGLGSSRANEGSATFTLNNGVAHSDDLEIRSSLMRLHYWGKLDLKGRVDATAEAELLRDTWMLGRFISLALWPVSKVFEYQITGTLGEPKSEPVFFVPKLVLFPFHPLRTLRDLAPEQNDGPTNAPPSAAPK